MVDFDFSLTIHPNKRDHTHITLTSTWYSVIYV